MKRKLGVALLLLLSLGLILPTKTQAHLGGKPPFLVINGEYVPNNPLYNPSKIISVPQDQVNQKFLKNEEINFNIDTKALGFPSEVLVNENFRWQFDEGDKNYKFGLQLKHAYNKIGSHLLTIEAKTKDNPEFTVIDTALINVVPRKDYQLPTVRIGTIGQGFKDGDEITFHALVTTDPSALVKDYLWDLSTGKGITTEEASRVVKNINVPEFINLRVTDSNGLYGYGLTDVSTQKTGKVIFNRTFSTNGGNLPVFERSLPNQSNLFLYLILGIAILLFAAVLAVKYLISDKVTKV